MSFESKLNQAINVAFLTPHGFEKELQIIRETDYVRKWAFEPFNNYSTTLGTRYVRLARNFELWIDPTLPAVTPDGFVQANNLVHEAVHQAQREVIGNSRFSMRYLQRAGRYELEMQAYRLQIRHAMTFLAIPSVTQLQAFVQGLSNALANDYLLFGYRTEQEAYADMVYGL